MYLVLSRFPKDLGFIFRPFFKSNKFDINGILMRGNILTDTI